MSMKEAIDKKIKEHNITPEELEAAEIPAAASWNVFAQKQFQCEDYMSKHENKGFYLVTQVMAQRARNCVK